MGKVRRSEARTKFKFGDRKVYKVLEWIKVPAFIGKRFEMIEYEVIEVELPLLLEKNAMKKAETLIDLRKVK